MRLYEESYRRLKVKSARKGVTIIKLLDEFSKAK